MNLITEVAGEDERYMSEEEFRAVWLRTDPDEVAYEDYRDDDDPTWAFLEAGQSFGEAKLHGTPEERRIMAVMKAYAKKHHYEFVDRYTDEQYDDPQVAAVLGDHPSVDEGLSDIIHLGDDGTITYNSGRVRKKITLGQLQGFVHSDPRDDVDGDKDRLETARDPEEYRHAFESTYDVQTEFLADRVVGDEDDPESNLEFWHGSDYDVEITVPTSIKRKDGRPLNDDDVYHAKRYEKAWNKVMGDAFGVNIQIQVLAAVGRSDAQVETMFL